MCWGKQQVLVGSDLWTTTGAEGSPVHDRHETGSQHHPPDVDHRDDLPERDHFTRRDALALGETDQSLRAALRAGTLVRVRHGVYAPAWRVDGLDDRARHLLLARAAVAQQ